MVVSCHTSNVNKLHYLSIITKLKDGARFNSNPWPYAVINHSTHINQHGEDVWDVEMYGNKNPRYSSNNYCPAKLHYKMAEL